MTKPKNTPKAPRKGRPRFEDRGKTIEATKPWLAIVDINGKPMSRSTWYRRQAEERKNRASIKETEDRMDDYLKVLIR